jgi:hypothetical protein
MLAYLCREDYCEMKIKEKGLTGKSANHRRDMISAKKFDAFKEMAKAKASPQKEGEEKKDVFLEFLGHKILITQDEEGNGIIDDNDIPFVKGVTLKFDGCGGDVAWAEIKVNSILVLHLGTNLMTTLLLGPYQGEIRWQSTLYQVRSRREQRSRRILQASFRGRD